MRRSRVRFLFQAIPLTHVIPGIYGVFHFIENPPFQVKWHTNGTLNGNIRQKSETIKPSTMVWFLKPDLGLKTYQNLFQRATSVPFDEDQPNISRKISSLRHQYTTLHMRCCCIWGHFLYFLEFYKEPLNEGNSKTTD
jgi:hypothetical protein